MMTLEAGDRSCKVQKNGTRIQPGDAMPRTARERLYSRKQTDTGEARWYADFRDVGGAREALKAPGDTRATTDYDIALQLARKRLDALEEREVRRRFHGLQETPEIKPYVAHYLRERAREGKITESTLSNLQNYLTVAIEFFGEGRDLNAIRTGDVKRWIAHLRKRPNGNGGTLSDGTVRKYINALSNLYRYAISDELVPPSYNPVGNLVEKPTAGRKEAAWLEVPDAALFLEATRTFAPDRKGDALDGQIYPIVATFLLTGGRKSEVLGLDIEDVNFSRRKIRFRTNEHRRLKTSTSRRTVPLWPQL